MLRVFGLGEACMALARARHACSGNNSRRGRVQLDTKNPIKPTTTIFHIASDRVRREWSNLFYEGTANYSYEYLDAGLGKNCIVWLEAEIDANIGV
jgi:hypothetical protein